MGWIRSAAFRTISDDVFEEAVDLKSQDCIEHVEVYESETVFPKQPRSKRDADLPIIPADEVKKRDGEGNNKLWIVVDGVVLDCTEYRNKHPGGRKIIEGFGGQDCSWQWSTFHDRSIWRGIAVGLRVGQTEGVENKHKRPQQFVGLRKFGYSGDW